MARVFSGIKPTGSVHLGNLLGALRNWVVMQDEADAVSCVVDLHALPVRHDPALIDPIDPSKHLDGFRPIPLLALHNEGDAMVPVSIQRAFLARLRDHYSARGAEPCLIELHTFSDTGAPMEHAGFGRHANDAKNLQLAFLERRVLLDAQG